MDVLFPGSFDPFTKGHDDIVRRTLAFAGHVVIAIGVHPTKKGMLTPEERKTAIEKVYKDNPKVSVEIYEGLTTEFAKQKNIKVIVRGVRNTIDFEYEKNIADVNRQLTGIETILLFADPLLSPISSSIVRELSSYGVDTNNMLP
jgi:pantetheine-phosphate adenylyltransferase